MMSIGAMGCGPIAATCSGASRRARMPPWMVGCSVLTRPSIISGKPVWAETSVTATPALAIAAAEPPVDRISTPCRARPCASSIRPVLSDTEIKARCGFRRASPDILTSAGQPGRGHLDSSKLRNKMREQLQDVGAAPAARRGLELVERARQHGAVRGARVGQADAGRVGLDQSFAGVEQLLVELFARA